jgi:hypothetical protein
MLDVVQLFLQLLVSQLLRRLRANISYSPPSFNVFHHTREIVIYPDEPKIGGDEKDSAI